MNFKIGEQPCKDFNPRKEGYWDDNIHECFCKGNKGDYCKGRVSFCSNCNKDHHSNGYESCVCRTTNLSPERE